MAKVTTRSVDDLIAEMERHRVSRIRQRITLKSLEVATGINAAILSQAENGKLALLPDSLKKIREALAEVE